MVEPGIVEGTGLLGRVISLLGVVFRVVGAIGPGKATFADRFDGHIDDVATLIECGAEPGDRRRQRALR